MAKAVLEIDVSIANKKLDDVKARLEYIYRLVDRSWLLRLIFYGLKRRGDE